MPGYDVIVVYSGCAASPGENDTGKYFCLKKLWAHDISEGPSV